MPQHTGRHPPLLPEHAFVEDFVPITKSQSLAYRLRGTAGENIDYTE